MTALTGASGLAIAAHHATLTCSGRAGHRTAREAQG